MKLDGFTFQYHNRPNFDYMLSSNGTQEKHILNPSNLFETLLVLCKNDPSKVSIIDISCKGGLVIQDRMSFFGSRISNLIMHKPPFVQP